MANLYLEPASLLNRDFGNFIPFIGAGAGLSIHYLSNAYLIPDSFAQTFDGAKTYELAWQIGAGVSYKISDSLVADISYRLFDAGYAKASKGSLTPFIRDQNEAEFKVEAQEVLIGLRYVF